MKAALGSIFALLLLACSAADDTRSVPRVEDVARLEEKLSSHTCVSDLDVWERNYRFATSRRMFWPQSNYSDLDVIEFHYRRVGTITIVPGRNLIGVSENRDWPDSSSIRTVDGSFVISSGRLSVARCRPLRSSGT
jgi:hypothetical protein